jgi:hypothetical protein
MPTSWPADGVTAATEAADGVPIDVANAAPDPNAAKAITMVARNR